MTVTDIEGVIRRLDTIATDAESSHSRDGYFAVLYQRMTEAIRDHIVDGSFQDSDRMERLDVSFANRYFDAYDAYRAGSALSRCWRHAFDTERERSPLVFQHLVLGMNAHINLDLGIATAALVGSDGIDSVKTDFMRVNAILRSLIDTVQDGIGLISPAFKPLDWMLGRADEEWFAWELEQARDFAWSLAQELVRIPETDWAPRIERVDAEVLHRGRAVIHPGLLPGLAIRGVGWFESRDVANNIHKLRQAVQ